MAKTNGANGEFNNEGVRDMAAMPTFVTNQRAAWVTLEDAIAAAAKARAFFAVYGESYRATYDAAIAARDAATAAYYAAKAMSGREHLN